MWPFKKKKNSAKSLIATEALNLLLEDKVNQLINMDTMLTLLIRKGIITTEEFANEKLVVMESDTYKKIHEMVDSVAKSLAPETDDIQLSDEELDELVKMFADNKEEETTS